MGDTPNVNVALLLVGVFTWGAGSVGPNEKGDLAAGVTGDGAAELKPNPPVSPEDVDGNNGLGASMVDGEGVPNVNAGFGASILAPA